MKEFIKKAKEYTEFTKITPQLLKQFIRKIYLYEKTKSVSKDKGNTIEIVYTFERETVSKFV